MPRNCNAYMHNSHSYHQAACLVLFMQIAENIHLLETSASPPAVRLEFVHIRVAHAARRFDEGPALTI